MAQAAETLPKPERRANKPWISDETIRLLSLRREARAEGRGQLEKDLHQKARKQAKLDKTKWVEEQLRTGGWNSIKTHRKPKQRANGKLKDSCGNLVESDKWADTMADHLERIQWHVRPAGICDGPQIGNELPVRTDNISATEVDAVVRKLKSGKASGPDEIPGEFWQAVADTADGLQWLTDLCNACWLRGETPRDWHTANVASVYKKGRADDCDNYRPTSLVCVTYNICATVML